MPVIVTRPAREAHAWVHALQEAGLPAVALPLIAVGPAPDPNPVLDVWRRIAEFDAAMFVSGNAVQHFFELKPAVGRVFIAQADIKTRAFVTGPGSRDALLHAGVDAACIEMPDADAGQFDSEALWSRVAHLVRPAYRVLIVRGIVAGAGVSMEGVGRDWFARQVEAAGGQVEFVVSYQRRCPVLTGAENKLVETAAADGSIWLFSSSESITNLIGAFPQLAWHAAKCVATHTRIAQAARSAGFGVVCESRPVLSAVVASIESLQ